MNRWKAAGSHFLTSLLVIGGIAIGALLLWYPYALYRVAGLDRLLLVMFAIDVTAGPLLTLILYRPGKPGLKFDLTVVVLCQLAFLGYGMHALWQARPVFLVGTPHDFTLIFAHEIREADLARGAEPQWRRLSWTGPQLVGTRMPDDPTERSKIVERFIDTGIDIVRLPEHFTRYADVAPFLLRNGAKPIEDGDNVLERDIRAAGQARDRMRLVPLVSLRGEGHLLVAADSGAPLRTIPR